MSSLIIENIINSSNKNLKFDFSKSISENITHQTDHNYDNSLPIEINSQESSWNHINIDGVEKIEKVYYFKNIKHMIYFINEYMVKIGKHNKKPNMVIKNNAILVTLYTEDIKEVTDTDLQIGKYLDDINEDIVYIQGL